MLSFCIWFSAPSFWMGGGLESHCVGRVFSADGAVHGTIHIENMTTQRLSRPPPPPIQRLSAENHMLQLNIHCSR